MSVFQNALMFSILSYGFLYDFRFIMLFFGFLGFNMLIYYIIPGGKCNNIRRKIQIATWEEPKEGLIHIKMEIDCTKVLDFLSNYKPDEVKPTLTHFGIKAVSNILDQSRLIINGKLMFGKFVPFETVDVTCLIDIDNGNDLGAITIRKCDELSVLELAKYVKQKSEKIKKSKGDNIHKKRNNSLQYFPPFIVSVILQLTKWFSYYFGLNLPFLGINKNNFGGAIVTSIGMLGIVDAVAPHCNFMNCPALLVLNKVIDKPIVRKGQIVIAKVMNCNFTVDHRFIDGGKARYIKTAFIDVFENPEKFFDNPSPLQSEQKSK
ncbi:hypothetical protein IMG5_170060 [Ichthyophthirius multifiliis]|uniref:2-oxoacid dehydrogenase acyltransferase catalytic domain-containing protein n=1 Tax=Ichthyophthirius multifiliis TaxID=5932 RepID=G0R1E9_ICHMU|nr:hypothetical protein IMG5_170060 [Ichthyophthirius multifiliis]EGR28706.1 hypothetical protein IMG5_170060 [Ichthyophthirius multifiliis]|eukprot:XP_004029942.1 hypothetical protein IMG5_170060 [Ichthyophthirius multifiliis]